MVIFTICDMCDNRLTCASISLTECNIRYQCIYYLDEQFWIDKLKSLTPFVLNQNCCIKNFLKYYLSILVYVFITNNLLFL